MTSSTSGGGDAGGGHLSGIGALVGTSASVGVGARVVGAGASVGAGTGGGGAPGVNAKASDGSDEGASGPATAATHPALRRAEFVAALFG